MISYSERQFEGRNFNYHLVVDNRVDLTAKTVRPIIKSWATEEEAIRETPDNVEFTLGLSFETWEPNVLQTISQEIINLPWKPYKASYIAPTLPTLEELKVAKSKELNLAAQQQIYPGYFSDALGTSHKYPAKDKDQTNMVASVTDSYNPLNGVEWLTPFWCADANDVWAYRPHSAAQIQKAGSDGKLAILASLGQNATLQYSLSQATTEAEVSAIGW